MTDRTEYGFKTLTAVANSASFMSSINFGFSAGSNGTASLEPNNKMAVPYLKKRN